MDAFLEGHHLGPLLFSIGGKLSPVAIRDQAVRGELFVERALEAGLLKPKSPNVFLVVGAGAGGVAASLTAVSHGVSTLLIDRRQMPFSLQAQCPTRWIDPTLYDFPIDHWRLGQYPPINRRLKYRLAWTASDAQSLALCLWTRLRQVIQTDPLLTFKPWRILQGPPDPVPGSGFAEAKLVRHSPFTPNSLEKVPADLTLLATGAGIERTYLTVNGVRNLASGFPFWEIDPLARPNVGLPTGVVPKVLISGSGDGALQDFLRISTKCISPKELYRIAPMSQADLARVNSANDRAHRHLQWGTGATHDHQVLDDLHQLYKQVVQRVLTRGRASLRDRINEVLRDPVPHVQLVHECSHFSQCYGLNRYLALLIAQVLEERGQCDGPILISRRRLENLESSDLTHNCNKDPWNCHGKDHTAKLEALDDCRGSSTPVPETIDCNVLILRHGIDSSGFAWDSPHRLRQLLPYFLLG